MDNNIDKIINKKFRPIKTRIMLKHIVKALMYALTFSLIQAILWILVSYFYPILYISNKIILCSVVIIVLSIIISIIKKPLITDMIKQCDEKGMKERLITAYELKGRNDVISELQKKDALNYLDSFNIKSIKLFNVTKKQNSLILVLCSVLIVGVLVPNPFKNSINKRIAFKEEINKQIEKIERATEDNLSKEKSLTDLQKENYRQMIKKLSSNLRKTDDSKQALQEINKTENELLRKVIKENKETLSSLTQALGMQVTKFNENEIDNQINKLKEKLENNRIDKEQLKEKLDQIKQNIKDNSLKTQLDKISNTLSADLKNGTNNSLAKLDELNNILTQLSANTNINPANLEYLLQQMKYQIAKSSGDMNMQLAQSGAGMINSESNSNNKIAGQGGSGAGIGTGHTNKSSDTKNNMGNQNYDKSKGINAPLKGEYEKIYDSKRLGDGGKVSSVNGAKGEGDSEQIEIGKGLGNFNGYIPYNEVFREYRTNAMKNIERNDIPNNMKQIVKDYFISLDE